MKVSFRQGLVGSIVSVVGTYFTIETVCFLALAHSYGFPELTVRFFALTQTVFHIFLAIFLILCQKFFFIEKTGVHLEKVNIANVITIYRISMLPTILFLILSAPNYKTGHILIVVLALTFITDMIDGKLSRALNQVTRMGRILDSVSDYSLLIVVAVAYKVYNLLPTWIFVVIILRLFFHAAGMLSVLLIKGRVEPQPTIFGKIAIATMMTLFALEGLKLVLHEKWAMYFKYLEICAGVIVCVSIVDKIIFFIRQIKNGRNDNRVTG